MEHQSYRSEVESVLLNNGWTDVYLTERHTSEEIVFEVDASDQLDPRDTDLADDFTNADLDWRAHEDGRVAEGERLDIIEVVFDV
jgi:hypothetical protein